MRNKWLLFCVLYLSALTVSLSQLKIVPVLGIISQSMQVSMTQVSLLMSVFTIAGIVFAIPGAAVLGKLGPKKLLMVLMLSLIIGNLLGAFTNNYTLLLISRIIEGISFAMIIMVGIVFLSQWFAGGKVGLAIGAFTTFPATASVIAMNAALPISQSLGMSSLWLIIAALAAISLILVTTIIKSPKAAPAQEAAPPPELEKPSIGAAAANGRMWLLAFAQGCVAFILFTFITVYPQLFTGYYNLDPTTANFYAGLNGLFGIPFCVLAGIIIDKTGKPALLSMLSFILLAVTCLVTASLGPATYILHTLLIAMGCGLIIPAILAIAPLIAKKPILIGYTVAFINLIYYIGIFAGAPLVINAAERTGWQASSNLLTLVAVAGLVIIGIYMAVSKKKAASIKKETS